MYQKIVETHLRSMYSIIHIWLTKDLRISRSIFFYLIYNYLKLRRYINENISSLVFEKMSAKMRRVYDYMYVWIKIKINELTNFLNEVALPSTWFLFGICLPVSCFWRLRKTSDKIARYYSSMISRWKFLRCWVGFQFGLYLVGSTTGCLIAKWVK